jgi:hypothetical protein
VTSIAPDGAADARRKALEYFRAGFALDRTFEVAKAEWQTVWRLVAGLSPVRAGFWCVYD